METGKYVCPNIVSRKDILDKTKQKMKKKMLFINRYKAINKLPLIHNS